MVVPVLLWVESYKIFPQDLSLWNSGSGAKFNPAGFESKWHFLSDNNLSARGDVNDLDLIIFFKMDAGIVSGENGDFVVLDDYRLTSESDRIK